MTNAGVRSISKRNADRFSPPLHSTPGHLPGVFVYMTIAEFHKAFLSCTGVSTDTRAITPGSMFFALKGPSFDANAFAAEALLKGARYAVVDDPSVVKNDRFHLVPDVLLALQELARQHRRGFNRPVIAITGTNGKTTTKELLYAVLSKSFTTLATSGNLNNHIGVPLTLLQMSASHQITVIEMGANKPGDIAELAAIAEPTHGLITNVGKAHLEGFGGYEGVLRTKTELYTSVIQNGGHLFVNADDGLLMEKTTAGKHSTYGTSASADLYGRAEECGPYLSIVFRGRDGIERAAKTQLIGNYNLPNALAAAAIGQHFGVPDDLIAEALSCYTPGNNRSQFKDTGRNLLVLDAYNANPTSMVAALENFATMQSDRPKLVILGDMLELGVDSLNEHKAILELVGRLHLEAIFIGPQFQRARSGPTARYHTDAAGLLEQLSIQPIADQIILLKGSRGMKLETLVPVL